MERKMLDYLPPFIQNYKEMAAIMNTEQPEFELAWKNAENTLDDQFVTTATINGIKRFEKIYNIVPKGTDTIDERRFVILSKMNERPPYTMAALESMLTALCGDGGYSLYMNNNDYMLTVKLALGNESNFAAVVDLLNRMLPANIARNVSVYNTYGVIEGLTHEQLSKYTHDEVRMNVLV